MVIERKQFQKGGTKKKKRKIREGGRKLLRELTLTREKCAPASIRRGRVV